MCEHSLQDHVHNSMIDALQQLLPRMASHLDVNQLITTVTANVRIVVMYVDMCMYVSMYVCM